MVFEWLFCSVNTAKGKGLDMQRRIISMVLAVLMVMPLMSGAATIIYGIEGAGGATETYNEYFFDEDFAILIENKEAFDNFDYEEIYAGSEILIPLSVYAAGGTKASPVTDKQVKTDKLTFSYKIMRGEQYVGDLAMVDGKKLKIQGVPSGMYVRVPVIKDFASTGKETISIQLVLSVNDITYRYTQTTLNCRICSYVTDVKRNSIYGAKSPTVFKVDEKFNGEATFDFGDEIKYTAKVDKNAIYFLNLSRDANADIAKMYPGAYLEFYDFKGDKKTFASTGRLEIPVAVGKLSKKGVEPSLYVYRIDGANLTALGAGSVSFNSKSDRLRINARTLGSYVLSNQPLSRNIAEAETNILKSGYA